MSDPDEITLAQTGFDPLGPSVKTMQVSSGRIVHYIDEGDTDWITLLFFGGAGTTVRAFRLLEFARTLREQLRIRVVSVERNGLGQTAFDPAVGFEEHAEDVWSVLDALGAHDVSVVTISGGGPYAAHVAAAQPHRIRSMHVACAVAEPLTARPPGFDVEDIAKDPTQWWRFPDASAVHHIPGFRDSVIEEATRGVFARGRDTPPDGLKHAFALYQEMQMPDLTAVLAPAFFYWGSHDDLVPLEHLERWRKALPGDQEVRTYDGEGHDVQYRHWDQVLTDVAYLGTRVIVCHDGRTLLATPGRVPELLAAGGTLGLCAWR